MSALKDIGLYKKNMLSAFLNSKDILELILNKPYDNEDIDDFLYENIFPFLYVEDTQGDTKSYICFEVDCPRTQNFSIKDVKLIVWAYCHKDIMRYSKKGCYGTRADILADMVDRELNGSDKYGIGNLKLETATYIMPSAKFYGKQLIYSCQDFATKSR